MELSLLGGGRAEPTREPVLEPDPAQLVWQSSLQTSENQEPEPEPEPEQVQLSRHASGLVSERNSPSTSPSLEHIKERGVTAFGAGLSARVPRLFMSQAIQFAMVAQIRPMLGK